MDVDEKLGDAQAHGNGNGDFQPMDSLHNADNGAA